MSVDFIFPLYRCTRVSDDNNTEKKTNRLKPEDFHFIDVIGKGNFGRVILARLKPDCSAAAARCCSESRVYAVKVLDKTRIKRNARDVRNVMSERNVKTALFVFFTTSGFGYFSFSPDSCQESSAPVSHLAALLVSDVAQALLCHGLRQWRRAVLSLAARASVWRAARALLLGRDCVGARLPARPANHLSRLEGWSYFACCVFGNIKVCRMRVCFSQKIFSSTPKATSNSPTLASARRASLTCDSERPLIVARRK